MKAVVDEAPTLACCPGKMLDALARIDRQNGTGIAAGPDIAMRHAAVEIDGVARAERQGGIKIRVKLHRSSQDIEIFLARVTDQPTQFLYASRLDVDDDRNHHFANEIRRWIMVDVPL